MTAITYRLKPTEHFCTSAVYTGYGLQPSPGHSTESTGDCYSHVNEGQDALDETGYGNLRSRGIAGLYVTGRFEFTFGALPSGLTISKVRIVAYLRMSNAGAESPDESPRVKGFVMPAVTRRYQSGPSYVIVTQTCNRNTQEAKGTFGRYVCGEWATNPETAAAWVLADLTPGTFKAGVEAGGIAEGQAGNGVPPTTGGSSCSLDLAAIELEVEATSTDLVIEPIRAQISRLLRLRRRARKPVRSEASAALAHAKPGDIVYASDPYWPTPGAMGLSLLEWDRRPLWVEDVEERVSAHAASIVGLDLRDHYVSWWSPLHTDLGADDQWTGLALIDQGGGRAVARAQGGWIWRPTDGLWRDAAADNWRITPWGLIICGGSYSGFVADTGETTWHTLNNTLSQGVGGEGTSLPNANVTGFTSWTVAKYGGATVIVKQDSSFLFDVSGYRRCVRVTNGVYGVDYAYIFQAVAGFSNTQRVRVCIKFKMLTGDPRNARFLLRRTTAFTDWNETTQTWSSSAGVWNQLVSGAAGRASLRKVGDHYEYWSSDITVGGAGAQTLTLHVGYVTEDNAVIEIAAAGIVSTGAGAGVAAPVLRREFIATQAVAIAQAGDVVDLHNLAPFHALNYTHGTLTVMVTPLWDHEDLADGAKKVVYHSVYDGTFVYHDLAYYERINATTGRWVFERTVSIGFASTEFPTSAAAGTLPRYLRPEKLSFRWTSFSGELGLPANSLTIHRDGIPGAAVACPGTPSVRTPFIALGRSLGIAALAVGGSEKPHYYLDGLLAHLEIVPFCLSDLEIARRHAQLTLPALPVAV